MGRSGGLKNKQGKRSAGTRAEVKKLVVDRFDKKITEPLESAPIFKKQGTIKARQVKAGEKIETVLADGRVETSNVSNDGDWVVTNPGGEEYIVPGEKFNDKYEATDKEGVFAAKGHVRAIENPFAKDISLEASWGELQHGEKDCMLVQSCDAEGNTNSDPYIVDKAAFKETYAPKTKPVDKEKPLLVSRNDDRILESVDKAPIFKKQGTIKARQVKAGEKIETVLADGRVETTNVSNDGDWVVTNPSGEEYIVPRDKFLVKYEPTETEGVFAAKGYVRAVKNPFKQPVAIKASWGELQHGDERCILVRSCDADGNSESDPYIIDLDAFKETYAPK